MEQLSWLKTLHLSYRTQNVCKERCVVWRHMVLCRVNLVWMWSVKTLICDKTNQIIQHLVCDCSINQCAYWIILQTWSKKSVKMYSVQSKCIFQGYCLQFCIRCRSWCAFIAVQIFYAYYWHLLSGTDITVHKSDSCFC